MNSVLNAVADRKQPGMLGIHRTNVVHDALSLQNILLTQHLFGILVLAVGAQDFTRDALAALFWPVPQDEDAMERRIPLS